VYNSYTERFAVSGTAQKHFGRFQRGGGQVPPLTHACGRPWEEMLSVLICEDLKTDENNLL